MLNTSTIHYQTHINHKLETYHQEAQVERTLGASRDRVQEKINSFTPTPIRQFALRFLR